MPGLPKSIGSGEGLGEVVGLPDTRGSGEVLSVPDTRGSGEVLSVPETRGSGERWSEVPGFSDNSLRFQVRIRDQVLSYACLWDGFVIGFENMHRSEQFPVKLI